MARKFNVNQFNQILEQYNQKLRATIISGELLQLSNNVILTDTAEIRKCKRRVMNLQLEYLKRFDKIYQVDRTQGKVFELDARRVGNVKGGKSCQQAHGNKIKQNLNTGDPWNKGKKLHYNVWNKGKTKDTDFRLLEISKSRMGEGNPMYGVLHSNEYKQSQSDRMKQLILSGEFTPNSNNSNTHWESSFNGKRYRSSWEAIFQAHYPGAEYETLRIPYHHDGNRYIYIVDFVDHNNKIAIEVKPSTMIKESKTISKITALEKWCQAKGYTMLIADEKYLKSLSIPALELFDDITKEKVKKLYEIS
jgi:hypothetical protein